MPEEQWGVLKKCEQGWRVELPPPSQEPRSPAVEHDGSCRRAHSLLGGAWRPRGPRAFLSVRSPHPFGNVSLWDQRSLPRRGHRGVWWLQLQDPTVRSRARSAGELPRCLSHPPSSRLCEASGPRVLGKQNCSCKQGEEINSQAFFGKGSLPVTGLLSCLISRDFHEA